MIVWLTVINGLRQLDFWKSPRFWFVITWILMFVYICFWCVPRHWMTDPCSGQASIDTIYLPPDTTVKDLPSIVDPIPVKEVKEVDAVFLPTVPELDLAIDCQDSIAEYKKALSWSIATLDECDSLYRDATAIREYTDSVTHPVDSITVFATTKVKGTLLKLDLSYRNDKSIMYIKETKEVPVNKRSVFLGVGLGPEFLVEDNQFESLRISGEAGYKTPKGHAIGAEGSYSTSNRWYVGPKYVYHFQW